MASWGPFAVRLYEYERDTYRDSRVKRESREYYRPTTVHATISAAHKQWPQPTGDHRRPRPKGGLKGSVGAVIQAAWTLNCPRTGSSQSYEYSGWVVSEKKPLLACLLWCCCGAVLRETPLLPSNPLIHHLFHAPSLVALHLAPSLGWGLCPYEGNGAGA